MKTIWSSGICRVSSFSCLFIPGKTKSHIVHNFICQFLSRLASTRHAAPYSFIDIRVLFIKGMTTKTMSFLMILCRQTNAAKNVFFAGYNFKMKWIYASSSSTKMIDSQSLTYWSTENFVRKSMRLNEFIAREKAISLDVFTSLPIPTWSSIPKRAVLVNFGKEFFYHTRIDCGDSLLLRQVHGKAAPTADQLSPLYSEGM